MLSNIYESIEEQSDSIVDLDKKMSEVSSLADKLVQ